jgi:hypothetical protein
MLLKSFERKIELLWGPCPTLSQSVCSVGILFQVMWIARRSKKLLGDHLKVIREM